MILLRRAAAILLASGLATPVLAVDAPAEALRPAVLADPSEAAVRGIAIPLAWGLEGESFAAPPAIAHVGIHGTDLVVEFHVRGAGGPAVARDDTALFEHAAVEVFLGADGQPWAGYYHISANAAGSIHDEFVRDGGWTRDPLWDAPVGAEPVEAGDDAWGVRLSIPLAILRRTVPEAPPTATIPAEAWFQLAVAAFPPDGPPLAAAWRPASSTFHDPEAFGRIDLSAAAALPLCAAAATRVELDDGVVRIEAALADAEAFEEPLRVEVFLRPEGATSQPVPLFSGVAESPDATVGREIPLARLSTGRHIVTRITDSDGNLQDQLVQDWLFREAAPVAALRERFRDKLVLRIAPPPGAPLEAAWIHGADEVPWRADGPFDGPQEVMLDTSAWVPGAYRLAWTVGGVEHSVPLARLADDAPPVARRWAFWAYAPDDEILGEMKAFEELTGSGEHLAGFIYGGSIDPATGALSALDLEWLRAWKEALPEAQMHLMIDGQGNFDLLDDDGVAAIAQRLVDELMPVDFLDGLHFDLEPYRGSQVRLTRKLTELGWTKPLSIAAGLATTIPAEQWASIDFMVVMNYDLARTPEGFARRAGDNARAFAAAAAAHSTPMMVGIPAVATHNEYALRVEAATGEIVERTAAGGMVPFMEASLEIIDALRADPEMGPHIAAPVIWAALARSQHIGLQRYRYYPNTIDGPVWDLMIEHDRRTAAP